MLHRGCADRHTRLACPRCSFFACYRLDASDQARTVETERGAARRPLQCAAQAQKLREKIEALKRAQHNAGHAATCNKLRQHMEKTEIALAKCQHRRIATQAQVLNFKKDVKSVEFLAKDISASQL